MSLGSESPSMMKVLLILTMGEWRYDCLRPFPVDEVFSFLKGLRPPVDLPELPKPRKKSAKTPHSFPDDWKNLISSYEPNFEKARKRFRKGYASKFAHFLTGNNYEPWSKSTTWRHVGAPNETNVRKSLGGIISLFKEWKFIEETNIPGRYQRVENSVPYLERLLKP